MVLHFSYQKTAALEETSHAGGAVLDFFGECLGEVTRGTVGQRGHQKQPFGGFHSHGNIPIAGWFLLGKIPSKNG